MLIVSASVFTLSNAHAETTIQDCLGCINNTDTQILTIFNFQTEDYPFLGGNSTFIIMPNPYAHTTNATDYLDLTTWFNFVVTDNAKFDSDPTSGIIELVGVNNNTYSILQVRGTSGFGLADHPSSSDDIFGTTGYAYNTQKFVNFTLSGTSITIEPPHITDDVLNKLKNDHGAKINGVTVASANDLPPAKMVTSGQKRTATPPSPVVFTTNLSGNANASSIFSTLGIPTYAAPKDTSLSGSAVFMPPVFVAPISGGGKFIMSPMIDEINPGTNVILRYDEVDQGTEHPLLNSIELPLNTYGTDVGISLKIDTSNPTGVAIPSGNVVLFLNFEETGDIDFGDSAIYSEDPTIHFNVAKDGTVCPTGIVLYLLDSGHWHEVSPAPTRDPSEDTSHTCAYSAEVEHFSSYLVGSGSSGGHSHDDSGDHAIHSSSHTAHSEHGGHGVHSHAGQTMPGMEEHDHRTMAYMMITKDLNIFEISYDLNNAMARFVIGTTGKLDDLEVTTYSKIGGVRTAYPVADRPQLFDVMGNTMRKYVFEVPLHPNEEYFRVSVEDSRYNLAQTVDIRGTSGTMVPWFTNIHEDMDHGSTHDTESTTHTSHITNTDFAVKFDGGKKTVEYNGIQFPIKYDMAGSITGINVDESSKSVTFLLDYVMGGDLTLQVPRTLVDAIDDNFVVLVSASPETQIDYDVMASTADYYTLKMEIPENAQALTIMGSRVVPEFGPVALLILVISFCATVMLVKRHALPIGRFS